MFPCFLGAGISGFCAAEVAVMKQGLVHASICLLKEDFPGCTRWLLPVIPALWEAKVDRSQGQDIETILANMVKPHIY